MTKVLISLLIIICSASCWGQVVQQYRYEKEKKYSDENFVVANSGKHGILLFREIDKKKIKGNAWEVIKLDTLLEEAWNVIIEVDYKYKIIGYEFSLGNLYLLFSEEFGGGKTELHLIKVYGKDGSDERNNIVSELSLEPTHLLINDTQLVLGGDISYRSTFVIFDYKNNKVKVVPGFYNKKSEILDFNYDETHKSYNVLLAERGPEGRHLINVISFDRGGNIVVDENHQFEEDYRALNGKVLIGQDNNLYFAGAYGNNNSYYSQGFFFGHIAPGKTPKVKKHELNKLEHVFDYMGAKRAARVKEKIRKGTSNTKSYEFKTQMLLQDFKEVDGSFSLLSDIYKPQYEYIVRNPQLGSNNKNYTDNTNQKYIRKTSGVTNSDDASSIDFYEAVLVQLDKNGKLLWDNSLPTLEVEALALDQVAAAQIINDRGYILYKDDNDVRYKIFEKEIDVVSDSTIAVATFVEHDEVRKVSDQEGKVQSWYDNNFIVWGYQRIENEQSEEVERKRNVFYINKLSVE